MVLGGAVLSRVESYLLVVRDSLNLTTQVSAASLDAAYAEGVNTV